MPQVFGFRLRKIQIRHVNEYINLRNSSLTVMAVWLVALILSLLGMQNRLWGRIVIVFMVRVGRYESVLIV